MRNLMLALLALSLTGTALSATEPPFSEDLVPEVVPTAVVETEDAADASMHLNTIEVEERGTPAESAATQLGPRGSFWWLVGVVVVAGVILAVVL